MKRVVALLTLAVSGAGLSGCVVAGTSRSDGSGGLLLLFLPALFLFFALALGRTRRRRGMDRRGAVAAPAVDRPMLRAELSVLADDVMRLEPQVVLKREAQVDFDAATQRYRVAQAALDDGGEAVDLVRVQRVVDEGTWLMSRVRAVLDDRPLPEPPATLRTRGAHGEPAVGVDEDQQPTYPEARASFSSGWFGIGGGLFGGLMLGSLLDEVSWQDDSLDGSEAGY